MTRVAGLALAGLLGAFLPWNPARAQGDAPLSRQQVVLAEQPGRPGSSRKVTCLVFPGMMLREVQEGTDIGSIAVSVVAAADIRPDSCAAGAADGAGGALPGHDGMSFTAAWGRFLLLEWPDGFSGTSRFAVYDAVTRTRLFTDLAAYGSGPPPEILPQGADRAELRYRRAVLADCSLVQGGPDCWARTQRAADIPAGLAAPLAECRAAYAAAGMTGKDLADPSVVAYRVLRRLGAEGGGQTAAGPVECWPAD